MAFGQIECRCSHYQTGRAGQCRPAADGRSSDRGELRDPEPSFSWGPQEHWSLWRLESWPFFLSWLEARKELVGHADGTFRRGLLLLETQLHAAVLTSCFKFRTHKCNICCGMRPSAHGMAVITSHLLAFQWERIKEVSEKVQDKSWLHTV